MPEQDLYEKIVEIAKRRGFFWPSFELYGGVSGFYTFGDLGTKLMNNIKACWRDQFIRRQGFLEISEPIITPSRVFDASGHLTHFKEYLVECSRCGRRFRADNIIEEETGQEFGEALSVEEMSKIIEEKGVKCPDCGGEFKRPMEFMEMFQTSIGATGKEIGYGRPEAAQGMFINFRLGFDHARERLPFALAQMGKVLRNEISPRKGIIRLREFTIMELELFFDPEDPACTRLGEVAQEPLRLLTEEMRRSGAKEPVEVRAGEGLEKGLIKTPWQAYFMALSKRFVASLGVPHERQRFKALFPEERAHYSAQTYDHEVLLARWGWTEVSGHAYRTDYDLKSHAEASGVDMTVLTPRGVKVLPHVVEPSFGLERLTYVSLEYAYREVNKRTVLSFPREVAPTSLVVLPLVTRDGLPEKAQEVYRLLLDEGFTVEYDDSGSIGRRYARADEAGTLIGVTIDYDTLKDETVTLRDRDTWKQVRQEIRLLPDLLRKYLRNQINFRDLGKELVNKR
jgi:glycyl-tRNA synthetase